MHTEKILCLNSQGFHKMAVHLWGKDKPGVPVVCVHGLTRNGRDFDRLAECLCEKSPVYCLDIVGRGLSDTLTDPKDYCLEQYARDIMGLMGLIGDKQVDWIGTSMGGLLGMMLASQKGTFIRRLVLNDVGPLVPKEALTRIGGYLKDMPRFQDVAAIEAHMRKIYAPFGSLTDSDWQHLSTHGHKKNEDGTYSFAYDPAISEAFEKAKESIDLWDDYDQITAPTLLVRGVLSDVTPKVLAQEMTQRGPRAKLVEIEGCGHAPTFTDRFQIQLIQNFL